MGNIKSIASAIENVGAIPILSKSTEAILSSDGVILPGVGAFKHGMNRLKAAGLIEIINEYCKTNKPLLGICLGMQMLFSESEEFGSTKGLGLISGPVCKLETNDGSKEKLPHISWNEINFYNRESTDAILSGINDGDDMYFVHSFAAVPDNNDEILAVADYGGKFFCAAVKKNNIYGCQFHPEKSGEIGLIILKNFVNISVSYK